MLYKADVIISKVVILFTVNVGIVFDGIYTIIYYARVKCEPDFR